MRIALVISSLGPGGAERVASSIANYWSGHGESVAIITLAAEKKDFYSIHPKIQRLRLDLLGVSSTPFGGLVRNIKRIKVLRSAIKRLNPDVVIGFVDQINVLVLLATWRLKTRVVVSERIDPLVGPLKPAWRLLRRLTYPSASQVVVQTVAVAAWATEFVSKRKVRVIPNFVRDLPEPQLRQTGAEAKVILAVGRLTEQKGFDRLLNAFADTSLPRTGWRLLILGEGPGQAHLEALANNLGLDGRVALPGVVPMPDAYMGQGGIFVLSSRYEGFPNALLEAMGMGMAVVSFDCPSGPAEIIRHGENGLLIPPGDVPALARALERLAANKALRHELGSRALEVRERFALPKIVAMWDESIERLLFKREGTYRMMSSDEKLKDVL